MRSSTTSNSSSSNGRSNLSASLQRHSGATTPTMTTSGGRPGYHAGSSSVSSSGGVMHMSNGRGAGGGQNHNALSSGSGSGSASSASSVGSMLLDTFAGSTKTPKLRVSALSDLVILHPNREDREVDDIISGVDTRPLGGASAGALIEGTVTLILPSAKKVDKLKVELVSVARRSSPSGRVHVRG